MFKLFDPVWECVFYLGLSCKFSKLQYNSLAFVAGFKRATDEGSLPEIAQYSPYYLPLNVFTASRGSNLYILLDALNSAFQSSNGVFQNGGYFNDASASQDCGY